MNSLAVILLSLVRPGPNGFRALSVEGSYSITRFFHSSRSDGSAETERVTLAASE